MKNQHMFQGEVLTFALISGLVILIFAILIRIKLNEANKKAKCRRLWELADAVFSAQTPTLQDINETIGLFNDLSAGSNPVGLLLIDKYLMCAWENLNRDYKAAKQTLDSLEEIGRTVSGAREILDHHMKNQQALIRQGDAADVMLFIDRINARRKKLQPVPEAKLIPFN